MKSAFAQNLDVGVKSPFQLKGPLDNINTLSDLISVFLSFVYPLIGLVILFFVIKAGITLMRSNGEKEKVKEGKEALVNILIGFTLFVASYFVVKLISYVLGFGGDIF